LEKVASMEAKNEALTVELKKKNLEQEMIKQKMKHLDQMFGNFVSNMNSSIQPE
jgi:S-adenosylmethionine hydrolase